MTAQTQEKRKRNLTGTVVSDKMQKTRVVAVTRLKKHYLYHKYYKTTAKFKVHDENNESHVGDRVLIEETRPLSKEKRWRLAEILEKSLENSNS